MIEQFGLWAYNDGWQVLLLVCVMLVAAGILMGILWNTKGLSDELSGRKRQKELEYLRHRFAEMNVRSLDEVNVADPLSHVGESAPMPLTPAGGAFIPRVAQPLGAGKVLNVGGVEVSQQQVAAIKSELLGDDEPATGFFPDGEKSSQETEETKGAETKIQPVKAEGDKAESTKAEDEEVKVQPVKVESVKAQSAKTEGEKAEAVKAQSAKKDSTKSSDKPASAKDIRADSQQGIKSTSVKPFDKDTKADSQQAIKPTSQPGIKSVEDTDKIAPIKPAMLLVQANAERVGKIYDAASEKAKVEQPAAKVDEVEKPITSKKVEEVKKPSTVDNLPASEQSTGLLAPVEDDESDSTPTGIFAPVKEDKKSETKDEKPVKVESASIKTVEPVADDASEGITAHLSPEPADDDEGVTTTFAPVGSRSAYHMKGAQFMGELISTGSYDPKTDTTKLEDPSGDDKATTGFLND
jgi:hypothetical protein